MDRFINALPTEQILWQRVCVASIIGECESLLGRNVLTEPAERSMRLLVAETLSAFGMQQHDERNAA